MKVDFIPCVKCEEKEQGPRYLLTGVELRDDLTFRSTCPEGHETIIIIKAPKFEILYDMGISALLDGYGREAVSSFAAAIERLHEFSIKVMLLNKGIATSQFAKTWKLVANQSERQTGAYYFLYLLHFQDQPANEQKRIEFRNKVIHKGYIPSLDESYDYAEYVYNYIVATLKLMKDSLYSEMIRVCEEDAAEMESLSPSEAGVRSVAVPTIIWLLGPEERLGKHSFESVLKKRREEHRDELENRLREFEEECEAG